MQYKHKQIGWLTYGLLGSIDIVILVLLVYLSKTESVPKVTIAIVTVAFVVLALATWFFSSLTTEVSNESVTAKFGPGFIRKEIPFSEISEVSVVKNKWWYGWGIRVIPGGWLLNVSGLDAVEIRRKDKGIIRIGTDEPQKLLQAIEAHSAQYKPVE
ncbi:MAG: hypothetical protein AAF518_15500 [Spirochaetota bacterium]